MKEKIIFDNSSLLEVTNLSQSNLPALFGELPAESFMARSLDDANFVKFWFQIKMIPLLPKIPREFLSCLNTRSFTCPTYRALYVPHFLFMIHDNRSLSDDLIIRLFAQFNTQHDLSWDSLCFHYVWLQKTNNWK